MLDAAIDTIKFFLLPLVGLLALNAIFNIMVKQSLLAPFYYFIVFPGVVIHEISHAVVAIITGAHIKGIKLFSKSGGYVIHSKSRIPIIGQVLISFAPVFGQIIVILLLSRLLFPELFSESWYRLNSSSLEQLFKAIDILSWQGILLLYIIISCVLSIAPSSKDITNALTGIAVTALLVFTLFYFNFTPHFKEYIILLQPAFQLVFILITVGLIALVPLVILNKLLGR